MNEQEAMAQVQDDVCNYVFQKTHEGYDPHINYKFEIAANAIKYDNYRIALAELGIECDFIDNKPQIYFLNKSLVFTAATNLDVYKYNEEIWSEERAEAEARSRQHRKPTSGGRRDYDPYESSQTGDRGYRQHRRPSEYTSQYSSSSSPRPYDGEPPIIEMKFPFFGTDNNIFNASKSYLQALQAERIAQLESEIRESERSRATPQTTATSRQTTATSRFHNLAPDVKRMIVRDVIYKNYRRR